MEQVVTKVETRKENRNTTTTIMQWHATMEGEIEARKMGLSDTTH